jgi:uncharacterized protein
MPPASPLDHELNDDELMELERFLSSPGLVESSLDVFGLEGFLAAVLASPRRVEPSEWIPWIWDVERGEVSPEFESVAEEERILALVMRLYDSVARALLPGAGEFEPLFSEGDAEAGSNWCSGFLAGTRFESEAWSERIDDRPKWFAPILGLGLEDEEGPRPRKGQIERWTRDVGPAVTKIHFHWLAERPPAGEGVSRESVETRASALQAPQAQRAQRPPGRNDPCPCCSGRKYKRCCGAGAAGAS